MSTMLPGAGARTGTGPVAGARIGVGAERGAERGAGAIPFERIRIR